MLDSPTREIFWQVSDKWIFYGLSCVTLAIFSWGLLTSILFIRRGATPTIPRARERGVWTAAKDILSHSPLAGEGNARWWHLLLFYGFLVLLFVTGYLMLAHYGHEALFTGTPYLIVTLVGDVAGAAVILGVLLALFTIRKDTSPAKDRNLAKAVILIFLGVVCLTGFLVEGLRIRIKGDPWKTWSPVGAAVATLFPALDESAGSRLFRACWWFHSLLALGFLAWIPLSSRLRHMIFLPLYRARTPQEPKSPTPYIDFRDLRTSNPSSGSVRLGIETGSNSTQGQRLGLVACMDCGRCERLCPAFQTGQPLTPRKALQDLREFVCREKAHGALEDEPCPSSASQAITSPSLWACRLCRACEELCPAGIEHVPQFIEIRRAEVLGHGRLPDEGVTALRSLARTGNPYGASPSERLAWIREQGIQERPGEDSGKALILWTGCFQPGDEQKPRVLACLVGLLKRLEIPFFLPQEPVSCCGDPARILGDEDLFQTLAREQIRRIEASGAEEVLVHCPHCYTVLKDVYPLLGARFSVIHTTEFVNQRIGMDHLPIKGFADTTFASYHDPCFLGRYQEIVEPPRRILKSIPGLELKEPPRSGQEGFCCGAGGGHFFMDLDLEERPSSQRLEEILAQTPDTLAVSCSFCFSMFDDALRRLPDSPSLRVADWLELLEESIEK